MRVATVLDVEDVVNVLIKRVYRPERQLRLSHPQKMLQQHPARLQNANVYFQILHVPL